MKRLVVLVALGLAFGGCAAKLVASKADMSNFRRDNFECSQQSQQMWASPLIAAPFVAHAAQKRSDRAMRECMEIRGYTITEEDR